MLVFENYILWVIFFLLRSRLFISNVQITFSLFYSMSVENETILPYPLFSSFIYQVWNLLMHLLIMNNLYFFI